MENTIYTIGHGTRSIEEFVKLLEQNNISFIVDVRSSPFSKYNPQYNGNTDNKKASTLKNHLEHHMIQYIFMGNQLGGRPKDDSCYDEDGKVSYATIQTKDFFKKGIARLKTALGNNYKLALMCSESKPIECHRSKLIGEALAEEGIEVKHIDETGKLRGQQSIMNELTKGLAEENLFGEKTNFTSRKSYR